MSHTLNVAAAQTRPVRGDLDANLAQHLALAHHAAHHRARLVLFPELSLTGYELDLAHRLAFTPDDPRLAPLHEAAARCDLTLVVGAPLRLPTGLHLAALVIHPRRPLELYTKHHLGAFGPAAAVDGTVPPAEHTVFAPGRHDPLLALGTHRAALAICADVGHPDHARRAAARGATLYLASMFVIPSELERERQTLAQRARRHALTIAVANFAAPSGGLAAAGHSAVLSPRGERLAELDAHATGLVLASIDADHCRAEAIPLDAR